MATEDKDKKAETTSAQVLAFRQIARDPACIPFIEFLEAEKRAVEQLICDNRVISTPTVLQAYVGELRAYSDLLDLIHEQMQVVSPRRTWTNRIKKFFKSILTRKKKSL